MIVVFFVTASPAAVASSEPARNVDVVLSWDADLVEGARAPRCRGRRSVFETNGLKVLYFQHS